MADRRYTFVFYTAVAVAAAATFGVYRVLESTKASNRVQTQSVVVAARDLPEGASIAREDLSVGQWPVAAVPAGAFSRSDSLVGRVTRVPVFTGEAIVPGRLAPTGTGPGLEVKITPGKRAMAVRVNDVSSLSGMIQPNSRVDVMVTLRDDASNVAKLFMENMRVLSVGTRVERDRDGKPIQAATAALEVTPEEAERLAVAEANGRLQLVLRGYGESDSVKTSGARAGDVLSQLRAAPAATPRSAASPAPRRTAPVRQAPPPPPPQPYPVVQAPPPPPKPESTTVQIIRGATVTQQQFQKDTTRRTTPPR